MASMAPHPLAAVSPNEELALRPSEQATTLSACSDKILTSTCSEPMHKQLGRGSAMFSTGLGLRPQRKLRGPPHVPVIVRSDMVRDVVTAAAFWRNKYPYQYSCVFPKAGWNIDDLWDEEDIHLDTERFCKEVLRFIERDNGVRAQMYSQEWAKLHPHRLAILGGDMNELYDKIHPLAIVDKIFVNNERQTYPPIFLWHVAHLMRTAMLAVKGIELLVKEVAADNPTMDHDNFVTRTNVQATATAKPPVTVQDTTSTLINASTLAFGPMDSMPGQPYHTRRADQMSPSTQGHIIEPMVGANSYSEQMGHRMSMLPTQSNVVPPPLRIPRHRPERSSSGTYSQFVSPNSFFENTPRIASGLGPRQSHGPASLIQSPRHMQGHMVMSNSMVNFSPATTASGYERSHTTPSIMAGQGHSQSVMQPIMPSNTMQNHPMAHGFPRQTSASQGIQCTIPMGDVTNMHYAMSIPPHNMDFRPPADRRSDQLHTNSNGLYDPYDSNNPAFRAVPYANGKKYNQHGSHIFPSRQRKTSYSGNRPNYGQYGIERSTSLQTGPNYGSQFARSKSPQENDRAITGDKESGCYHTWIGPLNETVNELFVKDLPPDVQYAELEAMFFDRIGFKPTAIRVKSTPNLSDRKHAFVEFSTTTIAKKAIALHNPTIRGLILSITVPKRFFRKTTEFPLRDAVEAGPTPYSRYTGNPNNREFRIRIPSAHEANDVTALDTDVDENLSYSPQDARSDLHKTKKKTNQPQQSSTTVGSPETRKTKPKKRQESLIQESLAKRTGGHLTEATQQDTKVGLDASKSVTIPEAVVKNETPAKQPQAGSVALPTAEEVLSSVATQERHINNKDPEPMEGPVEVDEVPGLTQGQRQIDVAELPDPQPAPEVRLQIEGSEKQDLEQELKLAEEVDPQLDSNERPVVDSLSDKKLKNEASFHSAAESQTELRTIIEVEAKSGTAHHGTTSFAPNAPKIADDVPPTPAILTSQPAPEGSTLLPQHNTQSTPSAENKSPVMASTAQIVPPVDPKSIELLTVAQEGKPAMITASTATETVRKVGAQHTESLHPFSKAAKALAKKEREQKKKAQKREREQIEKTKLAKAAMRKPAAKDGSLENDDTVSAIASISKSKPTKDAASIAEDKPETNTTSASTEIISSAGLPVSESTSLTKTSEEATCSQGDLGQRKSKKEDSSIATAEDKDADHGKQIGNTSSLNESSSVTYKEVNAEVPKDALEPNAQSSKQENIEETTGVAGELAATVKIAKESSPSAKRKPKKKKKKGSPAWPSLEFRAKSPNPSWMGPIDSQTDVQNYEEIINRACGGEDDSDFSWSDLPNVEDILGPEEGDCETVREDSDDGQVSNTINQQVASLESPSAGFQANYSGLQAKHAALQADKVAVNQQLTELQNLRAANKSNVSAGESSSVQTTQVGQVDNEASVGAAIRAIETQIAAHKEDIEASEVDIVVAESQLALHANSQVASNTAVPQSAKKKKKPNNRKNKKKKKAAETSGSVNDTEIAENTNAEGSIDSNDPFSGQLAEIEAFKRGNHGGFVVCVTHSENSDTCDEPQLMRTMEAYFEETQGSSGSKETKSAKEDVKN